MIISFRYYKENKIDTVCRKLKLHVCIVRTTLLQSRTELEPLACKLVGDSSPKARTHIDIQAKKDNNNELIDFVCFVAVWSILLLLEG